MDNNCLDREVRLPKLPLLTRMCLFKSTAFQSTVLVFVCLFFFRIAITRTYLKTKCKTLVVTEKKTRTIPDEGDCPIFEESLEFYIHHPDMALIRFIVLDDEFIGDDFIGQYTIPFACIRPGFLSILLLLRAALLALLINILTRLRR